MKNAVKQGMLYVCKSLNVVVGDFAVLGKKTLLGNYL